jgi:hypothetical protein
MRSSSGGISKCSDPGSSGIAVATNASASWRCASSLERVDLFWWVPFRSLVFLFDGEARSSHFCRKKGIVGRR